MIRNETVAGAWLGSRPPLDTPLVHYIFEDFENGGRIGRLPAAAAQAGGLMRARIEAAGELRLAWAALLAGMAVSATWLMIAGDGLTFVNDDVFYYAQYVVHGTGDFRTPGGIEYFLAPSNGHLQVLGKLIYRAIFEVFGADYAVFRAFDVAGAMVCVGLFFELARRRVGPLVALVPCLSLLFLGYAWESFLWAFDLHTIYALALGLGAVLALQRGDRRGDVLACLLLTLSIAMIELGLAFAAGIAISVLIRPDRLRRLWIFLIPVALYGCWWIWAQHFDQPAIELANVKLIPLTVTNAVAAIAGSVFGLNPTGAGVFEPTTGITGWGSALGALAVVALAWRVSRGGLPRTIWVFLGVALSYWVLIALGDRAADSSRYIFVGTLLVYLVAADALAGARLPALGVLAVLVAVAFAIPPNVAKLYDGRGPQLNDATTSRVEYAMLDLVRGPIPPDYAPGKDERVTALGGSVFTPLGAGDYLRAARRFGRLGMPLGELREQSLEKREVADASLIGALGLKLRPAAAPADPAACPSSLDGRRGHPVFFRAPSRAGVLLGSRARRPTGVSLLRFATGGSGFRVGRLPAGRWGRLRLPADSAPDPWFVVLDGPAYVCPL